MDNIKKSVTKTKSKRKKMKAFHQKVKVFRAKDPRMAVLMWGVSQSISQLSHVAHPVMLLKDDFKAYSKIKIDNHLYNKENMPGHFKFKEYMPLVFRNLRERFNIEEQLYARSFLIQPCDSNASGNSGAKFLITKNKMFYIKTIEREEVEMMHQIMPSYHQYVVESHSNTLLPQYLGMYRTTIDSKIEYYLIIRSVFSSRLKIHKKYDLKGSRVDREAKDSEKGKDFPTFKDNDFTRDNAKISIGAKAKEVILEKLKNDINFLSNLNIMDYSLLVGIHDTERDDNSDEDELDGDEDFETGDDSGDGLDEPCSLDDLNIGPKFVRAESTHSNDPTLGNDFYAVQCIDDSKHEIYYIGIIDVLTYYGATKKAAHAAKTVKHGTGAEISTVKPHIYASRFLEFIETAFE
ncbi:phosphatidylinositol 5-phosphate 4-kinase type-2 alpha isoform X3 [Hydra vulgaris]|uniref:Phosphatidylinositol 5-phosphate 4-kinase type-2 alpha isoform X3 n=1 Tax=Hydra vulgaris TaxID=6087 RepID=A0ABM4CY11_HYDVU